MTTFEKGILDAKGRWCMWEGKTMFSCPKCGTTDEFWNVRTDGLVFAPQCLVDGCDWRDDRAMLADYSDVPEAKND